MTLLQTANATLAALKPPPAPYTPQTTSAEAYESIAPLSHTLRQKVYNYLVDCRGWGATDEEMQAALDMNPSTQRPRRIELLRAGRIEESGEVRKTASGRDAIVWRVAAD